MDEIIQTSVLSSKAIFEENKKKLKEMHEQVKTAAKAFFKDEANALFTAHPELESFSWTQYTPYWNDGDTCYFGVHADYPEINGEEEFQTSKYNKETKKYDPIQTPLAQAAREVKKFLRSFDKNDMEEMFGDHVRVTVTKDNVSVDDYEHE